MARRIFGAWARWTAGYSATARAKPSACPRKSPVADIEVTITRLGDRLTIEPKRAQTVADFIALVRRMGPAADGVQASDPVEPPERLGL